MQERDVETVGSLAGGLVYEAQAFLVAHGESLAHSVLHLECYVVYTAAAVVQELLYCALGACGLQQFKLHLAHLQEGGLHLLVLYNLCLVHFQAQYIAEVGQYGIDALHGDAQVFNA